MDTVKKKRTYNCRHCGGIHTSPAAITFCPANPNIEANRAMWKEKQRAGARKTNSNPANRAARAEQLRQYNSDPANQEKLFASRGLGGKHSIKRDRSNFKISPSHRIALSRGHWAWVRKSFQKYYDKSIERLKLLPPVIANPIHDFFKPRIEEKTDDYWVNAENDDPYDLF